MWEQSYRLKTGRDFPEHEPFLIHTDGNIGMRAEHKLLRLKPRFHYLRSLFNSNLSFHCYYLFVVFLFTILPVRIQTETLVILAQHWGLIGIGEISLFFSFVTNVLSSKNSAWHMVDMQQITIDWRGSWSSWMLTFILEEPGILGAKVIRWVYGFFELHDLQRHFKNTIFMKNISSYRTEDIWGVKPNSWATLGSWSQLWFCVLCLSKGVSLPWDTVALCFSDTLGPAHSEERESTEICGPFVILPLPDCKLPKEQACFILHGCPKAPSTDMWHIHMEGPSVDLK